MPSTATVLQPFPTRRILGFARALAREVRHTPDRLLHPLRRWRIVSRLRRRGVPASILFVCHGNICRSPYAEAAFLRELPAGLRELVTVRSAGFVGPDRGSPREAISVAKERGIDLREHRSRLLTLGEAGSTHLLVVMDTSQRALICQGFGRRRDDVILLGDLDPEPIETRTVIDPILQPAEVFAQTYARVDRCVATLARAIAAAVDA